MRKSTPYVLTLPLIAAFLIFLLYPLYKVFMDSFYQASFLNPFYRKFVGLDNYKWLFTFKLFNPKMSYFLSAFWKSLVWVSGSVGIKVVLGVLGASLLNSRYLAGKKVYRTLVIIPWAIPWAMASMMWAWTLNSEFGVVNSILMNLHIVNRPVTFLSYPTTAFLTTMVVDAWMGLPFMIIMILSGLQTIPESLYEAATIDGAGDVKKFFYITIPMIKPVLLTVTLLSTVWTFNSFDIIWILTQGGPMSATETLPVAIYKVAFLMIRFGGIGKASAMTIFQVAVVTLISVFYIRTLRKGAEL